MPENERPIGCANKESNETMIDVESPDDEIDGILSGYFKAQLPARWPAFEPLKEPRAAPTATGGWSSRSALAASVALLLGLGFALVGTTNVPKHSPDSDVLRSATADGNGFLNKAIRPAEEPMEKP